MAALIESESETDTDVVVVPHASRLVCEILSGMSECKHFDEAKIHLERICSDETSPRLSLDEQDKAQRWLRWAGQRQHLKLVKAPVPRGILPEQVTAELTDVKVFTKRGPDDGIFENNKDIREKVARGNCFLRVSGVKESSTSCIVYALKKFTGGLGDDDDKEKGDNFTWKKFFTKSLDETEKVICTRKANGEAAHLSCVEIAGELFICGGSKNVHMLIKKREDIGLYDGSRFWIAKEVCSAIMDFLDTMSAANRQRLLQFLAVTRLTTIFEILSPLHQHVEDLSYLRSGELVFITWTSVELEPTTDAQLCPLPPHIAIEVARSLGLKTVDYDVIPYAHVDDRMTQVRHGYQYEGEVFYFLDNSSNVIGLLKKKTVWYIICRAIREKARHVTADLAKSPDTFSLSASLAKVEKRLTSIQSWLDLDDTVLGQWKELGVGFIRWLVAKVTDEKLGPKDIADTFPVTWKKFIQEEGLNDRIEVGVIAGEKT